MSSDDSRWVDAEAGPVARPYMLTGGRTRPRGRARLDLIDYIVRTGKSVDGYPVTPERGQLLQLCRKPTTVADLASATAIPLGLVRVLLADLISDGLVTGVSPGMAQEDAEHLAALAAGVHSLARGAGQRFHGGNVRQTIIEMDAALLFITTAGHSTCLAVLADSDADAGQVAYEMTVLVKRLGQHLGTNARTSAPETGAG